MRGSRAGIRFAAAGTIAAAMWAWPAGAAAFVDLGGDPAPAIAPAESRAAAETCLAQAISYEAGQEPEAGQEAVAQVVLNRLHGPGFPKTICGVVFQGASRRTGCQFTFTCDGSIARRRAVGWDNAIRIARLALDGQLASAIGRATHYHAYYVAPAWSTQLTRVARIGAHIFYGGPAHAGGGSPLVALVAASDARPGTPRPTAFSAWGLQTSLLVPTGGGVEVRAVTAPTPAGDGATPPPGSDMADRPSR